MNPMHLKHRLAKWVAQRDRIRITRTKLGLVGYAHLAAMLVQEPCTAIALAQKAHMGHVAAYRFLISLHTLRRVHVRSWEQRPRVRPVPVFAFGPGQDAPPPIKAPNGRPVEAASVPRARVCASLIAFESLLKAIEQPASLVDAVESTGLHCTQLQRALRTLVHLGLAHVALWVDRPQGGRALPQYQLGDGPNAPEPTGRKKEIRPLNAQRQRSRRTYAQLDQTMRALVGQVGQGVVA